MTTKPAKIAVVPLKFSGRINQDAFKYLQSFELAAASNTWNDDLKIKVIPNYLTDTALLWYYNYVRDRNAAASATAGVPTLATITWSEFTTAIQLAFKTVASKEVAEQKLLSRKQQIGESPEDYAYSMLDLIHDFDLNMAESIKIRYIIKGLRPSYLEKIHFLAPTTVDETISAIRRIAETQYMITQNVDINPVSTIDPLKDLLKSFQSQITNTIKI